MTVPIALHQFLVQGQQNHADLQPGCQGDQRDRFAGPDMARFEFFDKGHGVGRRCRVAVAIDGDDGVVPGTLAERCRNLAMPLRIARAEV